MYLIYYNADVSRVCWHKCAVGAAARCHHFPATAFRDLEQGRSLTAKSETNCNFPAFIYYCALHSVQVHYSSELAEYYTYALGIYFDTFFNDVFN